MPLYLAALGAALPLFFDTVSAQAQNPASLASVVVYVDAYCATAAATIALSTVPAFTPFALPMDTSSSSTYGSVKLIGVKPGSSMVVGFTANQTYPTWSGPFYGPPDQRGQAQVNWDSSRKCMKCPAADPSAAEPLPGMFPDLLQDISYFYGEGCNSNAPNQFADLSATGYMAWYDSTASCFDNQQGPVSQLVQSQQTFSTSTEPPPFSDAAATAPAEPSSGAYGRRRKRRGLSAGKRDD